MDTHSFGFGKDTLEIVEIFSITLIFFKIFYGANKKRGVANERKARNRIISMIVDGEAKMQNPRNLREFIACI